MEWWLAILGFIMSLLAPADLAYKYGPPFFKKARGLTNLGLLKKSSPRIRRLLRKKPALEVRPITHYRMVAGPGIFRLTGNPATLLRKI